MHAMIDAAPDLKKMMSGAFRQFVFLSHKFSVNFPDSEYRGKPRFRKKDRIHKSL